MTAGLFGPPVVAYNADGRLELFAKGSDSSLYHIWQTSPGSNWSNWDALSQSSPIPSGDFTFTLTTNVDSRFEIFAMTSTTTQVVPNPNAYHSWQASPGGSWSNWDALSHP